MSFARFSVGQMAEYSKTISDADVVQFAELTGDRNPVHLDQTAAERSVFGGRIVHGMFCAGLISTALGMELPGPGTIYITQSLTFSAPVYIGDTVTARVEILELFPEKKRVRLRTTCITQNEKVVLKGEALVMVTAPDTET